LEKNEGKKTMGVGGKGKTFNKRGEQPFRKILGGKNSPFQSGGSIDTMSVIAEM